MTVREARARSPRGPYLLVRHVLILRLRLHFHLCDEGQRRARSPRTEARPKPPRERKRASLLPLSPLLSLPLVLRERQQPKIERRPLTPPRAHARACIAFCAVPSAEWCPIWRSIWSWGLHRSRRRWARAGRPTSQDRERRKRIGGIWGRVTRIIRKGWRRPCDRRPGGLADDALCRRVRNRS